ncbi:MAG: DUF4153 domain-containing protein [Sedimentibacter sp.]
MSKIKDFLNKMATNLKTTLTRFPIVLLFLAFLTATMFYTIEDDFRNESLLGRLFFTGIFGAMVSTAVQFMLERFKNLKKYALLLHALTIVLAVGYYYFMTNDDISQFMVVHLFVISFALFAAYLYMPSAKNNVNFGNVALAHFKAAFTAILYGVVLYLGFVAIFGAIDILLFGIDTKIYAHLANIAFVFFTPVYYLSLLPKFNSEDEYDIKRNEISYNYPRVLEILVSYILIPLISIFSAVLIVYFIKILATGVWPVGQVGPMVLGYSAAGYFIYILGHNINNRFSILYRKVFPIVLIPLVAMQLVSSYIRVDAYGITESRYYVILFGIFSIVCALMLIISKKKNANSIVLLCAIFALLSIIPPVDAFTVSKNSQVARLEEILTENNMLVENEIVPNKDVSKEDKYEITSISDYLARMGYLRDIEWFPEEYISDSGYYRNFEWIYGFNPYYDRNLPGETPRYVYGTLDNNIGIDVSGYDKFIKINIFNSINQNTTVSTFNIDDERYIIEQKTDDVGYITLAISDDSNNTIIEIPMKGFINRLFENANEPKSLMSPDELALEEQNENMKVKIIINDISVDKTNDDTIYINGSLFLFVTVTK